MNANEIKVSKSSSVKYLAGAIVKEVAKAGEATIRTIGAAALNQAVKALIVGDSYIVQNRQPLTYHFYFENIYIGEKETTSIIIKVK